MNKLNPLPSIILLFLFFFTTDLCAQNTRVDKSREVSILFLGDSLSEGYGIDKSNSYPNVSAKILKKRGISIKVTNGSVSGSTTASGKSRLKWFSQSKPDYVFLALGGNDALRGIKVAASKKNLSDVITLAKKLNIKVMLAGMLAPPNYGEEYGKEFSSMYSDLKKKHNIPTLDFLLEGVAGEKKLNQEDGIHPNESGHKAIALRVANFIEKILNS